MHIKADASSDLTAGKPPRPRRWIPLSLRMIAAILVVLLVGSVMSIWLPWYREQQVVRKIDGWGCFHFNKTVAPKWLQRLAGEDCLENFEVFERVVSFNVDLESIAITDAEIAHLSGLTQLRTLDIKRTEVTDAGLANLSGLTKLEWLNLSGTRVTDAGLIHLSRLKSLKFLDLRDTAATETGLDELKAALPGCEIFFSYR